MAIQLFIVALIIFLAIDFVWLGFVAKSMYRRQLGSLLLDKPNIWAALAFYVIYIVGLVGLVLLPAADSASPWAGLWPGALYGLVCYATYDLTNLATLKKWPLKLTIVDIIWGKVLTAVVSVITLWII
jgi:uncharacterized membrane protein